ncbi:MAG: FAD-binding domain-containing protein, partial [Phycisphaeraceae bacterium]
LNSLEGFVRQIIGWREFIRGIYQRFSQKEESTNYFQHHRKMKACWWTGETGLVPLDMAIRKALRFGWTHHIERLMVLANCMNLCEIQPKQCHDWFMSMYVDSSDWVMGPNVYGMGLMSDGGIFATKPYICGSNYIFKMSDYPKPKKDETLFDLDGDKDGGEGGANWADVMDGLYWRFIDRHRDFFSSNYRMAMMTKSLDKMKDEKKDRLFAAAECFIESTTTT